MKEAEAQLGTARKAVTINLEFGEIDQGPSEAIEDDEASGVPDAAVHDHQGGHCVDTAKVLMEEAEAQSDTARESEATEGDEVSGAPDTAVYESQGGHFADTLTAHTLKVLGVSKEQAEAKFDFARGAVTTRVHNCELVKG